jgi:hypothetical protein
VARAARRRGAAPRCELPRSTQAAGSASSVSAASVCSARPSRRRGDRLRDRREHELAERAAGVDDAGGHAAPLGGTSAWSRAISTDGPAMPAPPAPARRSRDQPSVLCMTGQRVPTATSSTPDTARGRRRAVGHDAGERLRQAPPQLAERERQADAGDAEAGAGVERADEQAHRLARAHRQREGAGGGEQHQRSGLRSRSWRCSLVLVVGQSSAAMQSSTSVQRDDTLDAEPRVQRELRLLPGTLRLGALVASRLGGSTLRLRASSPGPRDQPCATSGCRLRVSVEASSRMCAASSPA